MFCVMGSWGQTRIATAIYIHKNITATLQKYAQSLQVMKNTSIYSWANTLALASGSEWTNMRILLLQNL